MADHSCPPCGITPRGRPFLQGTLAGAGMIWIALSTIDPVENAIRYSKSTFTLLTS
jgi:hypothetical protein